MSTGSFKDVARILNKTFAEPYIPLPLPDEIIQTIDAFLQAHQQIDDQDSQRVQDELLSIYHKNVTDSPDKHGAFVKLLRLLQPAITGEKRLEEWWDLVMRPTIDAIGHKRETIEDAREFMLDLLVFDEDEDETEELAKLSAHFTQRLLDAYLARTKIPSGDGAVISPEDDFIAHELETVLVLFGRRRPKDFLLAIDGIFVQKQYRARALSLLSAFVRLQPPHLHLVLGTPLIEHLHNCLLLDGSSTVVDLAITILIMFLPHITSSLVNDLPTLFLIYSRLLCWDNQRTLVDPEKTETLDEKSDESVLDERSPANSARNWPTLHHTFDNAESCNPRVDYLFTFLYGLFPLNLTAFIRKPRKYLKSAQFVGADELDLHQDMIRTRTEPHRRVHLLHPNFYLTTLEEELKDNRWVKSDAADIVTECLNLCTAVSLSVKDPGPPPTTKLPAIPKMPSRKALPKYQNSVPDDDSTVNNDSSTSDVRSNNSSRNTLSPTLTSVSSEFQSLPESQIKALRSPPATSDNGASTSGKTSDAVPESPTLASHPPSQTYPEPPMTDTLMRQTSDDATGNVVRLESFAQALSVTQFPTPPSRSPPPSAKVASLQRENMLLRNDLNFERYLKQQHLSHIGQLQRKHIKEATVEAETQNLLNTNRTLKAKLAKANEQYAQLKRETTTGRSQSKKFEAELTSKIRTYREGEKQWLSDGEGLRLECEALKKDCENLRRMLAESEQHEFNIKNQLQMRDADLEELSTLRAEAHGLQTKLHELEIRELRFEQAEEARESLQTDVNSLRMKLNAKDTEKERARRTYETKIKDLEARLDTAQRPASQVMAPGAQLPASVQQMLDSAVASSQSRFNQLKKAHTKLLHKYTELEMRFADLEAGGGVLTFPLDLEPGNASTHDFDRAPGGSNGNAWAPPSSISPPGSMARRMHAFSEPVLTEVDETLYETHSSTSSTNTALPLQGASLGPLRHDSLGNRQGAMERARAKEEQMAALYERNLSGFLNYDPNVPLRDSSTRSAGSDESKGSGGHGKGSKTNSDNKARVFGRGGVQNVGGKKGNASKTSLIGDSKASKGSGGFGGIRGIL